MPKKQIAASYKNFHVIVHDLDETDDLKAACKEKLGIGVRLADWKRPNRLPRSGRFISGPPRTT